ncbi:invasion protein CiaB [Chrysiogenes arsenatis]|uniref:invasion protein CiaB n=1 Tax=Chrysiogenes arsenatis TaxID=309797 RepID=UPI0004217ED1|nr:invasion protein CiaB [Chrysiogenes arsenatis]
MPHQFWQDLQKLYTLVEQREHHNNRFYAILKGEESDQKLVIDSFLQSLDLPLTPENQLAAITRIANLRDDSLVQAMKQAGFDQPRIDAAKQLAYQWAATYHLQQHRELLLVVEEQQLLTPFYRALLRGAHEVGLAFTQWYPLWYETIVTGVNRTLEADFQGNQSAIMEMLHTKQLLDFGHENEIADRCYSVLRKHDSQTWSVLPYVQAFPIAVGAIIAALEELHDALCLHNDDIFDQADYYKNYIKALIEAFSETERHQLVARWADVDRKWMQITAPIQIGHPLEYYEDHYRKAVAPEWDVRIVNPQLQHGNHRAEKVETMFQALYTQSGQPQSLSAYQATLENLRRVQLYLGRPALYYGAGFSGLFSAQVVPNDEVVSAAYGKKIFAFADMVLASSRAKPVLQISRQVLGDEIIKRHRQLMNTPEQWHQVYDISTIGHEFGHILWLDENSENTMNTTGHFKNIEEFKATTGGLISFFSDTSEQELLSAVIDDLIRRSVGLIGWMETEEVRPYYSEGLIHLHCLFASSVLHFSPEPPTLTIQLNETTITNLKQQYMHVYTALAWETYLPKRDALHFLSRYVRTEGKSLTPLDPTVAAFVAWYWELYQKIGRQVADWPAE